MMNKNCKICNKEFRIKLSRKLTAKYCSMKCYSKSKKGKLVLLDQTGEKNGNWNPNKQSRTYPSQNLKYKVKMRDKNRCYICWSTDRLEVHHAKPFDLEPKHQLENLITLCHDCHWKVHNKIYRLTSAVPGTNYPDGRYSVWMTQ